MKNARFKNIIRNISGNLNRFLSILFIVALGSGFMAGLAAASPDMYDAADAYIRDYDLFDINIKSLVGFRDSDAEQILNLSDVKEVQGGRVFDMVLDQEQGSDFTSRVYGILDEKGETSLNRLNLTEGRLPENPSECIVESVFGKYTGESIAIGDHLTLAQGNGDYDTLKGLMARTDLTVVGICQSPMCISVEGDTSSAGSGTINLNVYVQKDFFTCDYDTDLYIRLYDDGSLNTFDDAYKSRVFSVIDQIRPIGEESCPLRADEMRADTRELLNQADKLLNQLASVSETQQQMSDDLPLRESRHQEVLELFQGKETPFTEALAALPKEPEDTRSFPTVAGLVEQIEEEKEQAASLMEQLDQMVWIYRTRHDQMGFDSYLNNVGKVSALSKIFPVFFFIVALLVALTTMSRLIEENRLQIGTLKAIGYSNFQILSEYLLFSFASSVAGTILGFAIGFRIFPLAISSAYRMMYILPPIHTPLRWDIIAWVAPITIVSILLAALWSCWNEFRSNPAILMLPKAPASGKRIWLEHIPFIWRRLSFNYKVTFRNLFRYKKRFIMTIIGVAGCSALLLTGFGIRDSVNDIVDLQFGEIYKYEMMFALDKSASIQEDPELSSMLQDPDLIKDYTTCVQETGSVYAGDQKQDLVLFVPSSVETFPDFVTLRDRRSRQPLSLPESGVILTEKMCEEMHIKKGDTIKLEDSKGHQAETVVTAIAENYVTSFAYMTPEVYQQLFGSIPDAVMLLCIRSESDQAPSQNDITSRMMLNRHILFGRSVEGLRESFSDSIQSINGVIYVLIAAAGLLCIVVLYNLTNVNICERRKELATLKVLGFYKGETQNYIFRETNILSFLGALVGLVLGIWLHGFVVRTVEVNHIMFGREIKPLSYLIALAISVVFTLIVDLIMKRPINQTDMVEAMKAND